jgi:transcriptional regulator with XRE-family HTH domain
MLNVLKGLRESRGYSQKELADAIGMSRQVINRYENGAASMSVDAIKKLSHFFDVGYECFIEDKMPVSPTYDVESGTAPPVLDNLRISIPQENIDKFKQVFLYIITKVGGEPNVGKTVLFKLLYFIDFDYYETFEQQLMGLRYIKKAYGPVPVDFDKIIDEMEKEGLIEVIKTEYFKHDQMKYLAHKKPDLSVLTGEELRYIDLVLSKYSDKTAAQISELSHKDVPWLSANTGDVLDYEAVFYRNAETSVRSYDEV